MRQIVYMLMLALLMPALADQGVPNLVGNWTSCTPGVSGVILGTPDHYPKDQLANSSHEKHFTDTV
jgi:hypothetical protein